MTHHQRMLDLLDQLETVYTGNPWFGPSWQESFEQIHPDQVSQQSKGSPTIAGLIFHVIAWRTFVIRKLQGHEAYDLSPEADWPALPDDLDWETLVRTFVDSQQELLEALTEFDTDLLDDEVPGRGYTWMFMIQGVINHDIYHLAQINLLRKQFQMV